MKTWILTALVITVFCNSGMAADNGTLSDNTLWGTHIPGIYDHLKTTEKVIALTFDACGARGDGYDKELIDYLVDHQIPATLFISGLWIKKNPETFVQLGRNSLFRIENHGTRHRQLSVDGKGFYSWGKTKNQQEIAEEVLDNVKTMEHQIGRHPTYFRSGTAHYDLVAIDFLYSQNYIPTGFSHSADGGTTFTKDQILRWGIENATAGGIYLFHMNWPEKATFEGFKELVPKLYEKGYRFVLLEDYELEQRIVKKSR